jgi:hypothetical protein
MTRDSIFEYRSENETTKGVGFCQQFNYQRFNTVKVGVFYLCL